MQCREYFRLPVSDSSDPEQFASMAVQCPRCGEMTVCDLGHSRDLPEDEDRELVDFEMKAQKFQEHPG